MKKTRKKKYDRPGLHKGDKIHAFSREYNHRHRAGSFTVVADMLAYLKVTDAVDEVFELRFHQWRFVRIENDKQSTDIKENGPAGGA